MRLFIGLRPPRTLLAGIKGLIDPLPLAAAGVGRTGPEDLHVTLAFLGEVRDEGRLAAVKARMDAAAGASAAIDFALGGLGAFPSLERPRVLWLGFPEGSCGLSALASRLREGLREEGFPPGREFVPHLTLGRLKGRADMDAVAAAAAMAAGATAVRGTFSSLELIESRFSGEKARYITLYSCGLL